MKANIYSVHWLTSSGSKPAALHAEVAAGSEVDLYWTLWPDSHVGPTVTYMAKCPDSGCNTYMPNNRLVPFAPVKNDQY